MTRRIPLTLSNSNSQARELLRLYVAPPPSFDPPCSLCHLSSSHYVTNHSTYSLHTRDKTSQHIIVFLFNKSSHKLRSLPNLRFVHFLPFSLAVDSQVLDRTSSLEVSQSPLALNSSQEDSPLNERAVEYNTKLSQLLQELRSQLPDFFEKSHPYHLYADNLKFELNYSPLSFSLNSKLNYQFLLTSIRYAFRLVYSDLGLELLKVTKSLSDCSIHTRWRLTCVNRLSISRKPLFFEAISTFYMNEEGLIDRHRLERVYKDTRKVPTLAWLFIAIGFYPSELKETSPAVEFTSKHKRNRKSSKNSSSL